MRALICGDRHWGEWDPGERRYLARFEVDLVYKLVGSLPAGSVVIEGEARGADDLARRAALELGYVIDSYPANWSQYGRAAGVLRNQQMLDEGRPDVVIYCHTNLAASRGTADMVRRATQARVPVFSIEEWLRDHP